MYKSTRERQEDTVRRMKQSPCQCMIYHPKFGTEIYNELFDEYMAWRKMSPHRCSVDKTWIIAHLMTSQDCPFIKSESVVK